MKIHFGIGGKKLPGWRNWDKDCDLKRPLPYSDNIVTHIFVENGVEYLTHQEAWRFFEECHRILIPNGFIRIAITDISEQWSAMTPKYRKKAKELGIGDGDAKSTIRAVIFKQGFQGCWNAKLLDTFLIAVGFKTYGSNVSHSRNIIEFNDLEVISDKFEPSIIEGSKF